MYLHQICVALALKLCHQFVKIFDLAADIAGEVFVRLYVRLCAVIEVQMCKFKFFGDFTNRHTTEVAHIGEIDLPFLLD